MKIRYIIAGLLLVLAAACSDDEGNYDYRALNTIKLEGLAEEYSVDQFDTLRIDDLELNFSVEENADVAYEWVVKNSSSGISRVVSTERNCRGYITESPSRYDAWLCVTDLTNDLKYYQEFDVRVNSPYQNGLYVLSEAEDGTAVLSMQRRDKSGEPLHFDIFEERNPDLGKMGKKPVQISYDSEKRKIYVVCGEGERKILKLDCYDELKLKQYWAEIDGYAGPFVPEFFTNDIRGGGMILSEGKLFLFNYMENSMIYSPIEGYDFSWVGTNPGESASYYYAYDEKSQKFKMLEPGKNPLSFDKISTLEDLNTAGQTYWNQGKLVNNDYDKICYPILRDQVTGEEHYYQIYVYGDYDYETWEYFQFFEYTEEMVRPAVLDENSICLLSKGSYWYASKGNKIIRYFFDETSEVIDWFTGLKGEVTGMIFDKKEKRVFVATYDGSKSYIYEIDATEPEKLLNEPLELPGKVVSMCVVGSWKF